MPLPTQVTSCARSYEAFTRVLTRDDSVLLGDVIANWRAHYLGAFADLDRAMMRESLDGRRPPDQLLAVSVSHHNLHRLIEVLELEIGTAPLSATQIPERIADLREVVSRLGQLLQTTTIKETVHA